MLVSVFDVPEGEFYGISSVPGGSFHGVSCVPGGAAFLYGVFGVSGDLFMGPLVSHAGETVLCLWFANGPLSHADAEHINLLV